MKRLRPEPEDVLTLIPKLAVDLLMLRTKLLRRVNRRDEALDLVLSRLLEEIRERTELLSSAADAAEHRSRPIPSTPGSGVLGGDSAELSPEPGVPGSANGEP